MVDILHRVGVKTPTPEKVYEALTTVEGLAGWWTDDTTGDADVGGVLDRVGLVRATAAGRERRYRVDDAQLARAVAQLSSVGSAWDARLQRIKRIAEAIQRTQQD